LALKENIKAIKEELSAQEQLLENIIASERFFKRHKRTIISFIVVLVILLTSYIGLGIVKESNLKASNEAYKVLINNPNDENALSILKNKNKPLYRVFIFTEALKSGDNETLKTLLADKDVISDLAAYQLGESMKSDAILEDFTILKDGYELLKDGKTDEANMKFMTISSDSALMSVIKGLEHYQPSLEKKE
jgi:hypothetical protein